MPRMAREESSTLIYHIMIRGINKQAIFIDDMDNKIFLKYLTESKKKFKFKLFAYCLMGNHIHILLRDDKFNISKMLQSISIKYSRYFNEKYKRVGHVFQNRFKSQCVETDDYLANVYAYIHENPAKSGICKTENYSWSSYLSYTFNGGLVDVEDFYEIFDENIKLAKIKIDEYCKYKKIYNINDVEDEFSEQQIIDILKDEFIINELKEVKNYSLSKRNRVLYRMRTELNLSIKYIGKLVNMNEDTIRKALRCIEY